MRGLIIDRRKWARGNRGGESALFNDIGGMCCLGFDMRACGISPKRIKNLEMPRELQGNVKLAAKKIPHLLKFSMPNWSKDRVYGWYEDTKFATRAASINDNDKITERTREKRLVALFEKQDIALEFIN